jgi:hypothetical protein
MMVDVMRIENTWKFFNKVARKFELYPVSEESKKPVKIREIRELSSNIPFYFAVIEEIVIGEQKLFKSIILTEEIILGYLNKKSPIIKLPKFRTILVALPVWIYLTEKFLDVYSYSRGSLKAGEDEKILKYAETTKIPQDVRGKFINLILKLFAPYNTNTILNALEKIESTGAVIRISDELKKYFEEKYKYTNK